MLIKNLLSLLIFLFLFSSNVRAQLLKPGVYHFKESEGNYSVFIPSKNTHKMILALHGSGERAHKYIKNWLPEAVSRNYLVLVPNAVVKWGWQLDDVERIEERLIYYKKNYQIKRTLLSGASAGGQFALFLGINYYQNYDAIAVFMGTLMGGPSRWLKFQNEPKKKLPILMIHGSRDEITPLEHGRLSAKFLQARKYKTVFIEEKDMQHEHYRPANEKILNWFEKLSVKN
jgi:predicted esterase